MTLFSATVASTARLTLALEMGLDCTSNALQLAAGKWGSEASIMRAVEAGMPGTYVTVGALQSRNLSTLQWLVEEVGLLLPDSALSAAAFGGCTDILAYLKQRGMTLTADLLEYAALNGHWNAVQYLHNEGLEWASATCATAARSGHLTLLQQLREHGCPWDADEIGNKAAWSGSIPLLKWLKNQGVVFTERTIASAVYGGHIAACEYLRFTEHCPWNIETCMFAARFKQQHALKWLREHGCPCIDAPVRTAAAHGGSVDVMAYMLEEPEQQQLTAAVRTVLLKEMLAVAGANQQLAAAQWLRAQGADWPDVLQYTFDDEPQQWSGAVLAWARAEGCTSPVE
jgi:hypothetical protein